MLLQPTESSANLTTFSPKWPAAHSKKVRCTQMKDAKTTFFLSGALRGMNKPISESLPEEIQTVNLSRQRLWELLSPANLGSDPTSWQRSYHRFLHEEGVDAEMQKRAVLFQLWTTQVGIGFKVCLSKSHTSKQTHAPTVMPNPPFHTQTACLNSTLRRSANKHCISQSEFLSSISSGATSHNL